MSDCQAQKLATLIKKNTKQMSGWNVFVFVDLKECAIVLRCALVCCVCV